MVEILEKGHLNHCTCENCGSELSYSRDDIASSKAEAIFKYGFKYRKVAKKFLVCPQCKSVVVVDDDRRE